MTRRADEVLLAVVAALRAAGATPELPPVRGSHNHLKLWFWYGGRRGFVTLPSTPGDDRTRANCVAFARQRVRTLGTYSS